MGFRFKQPIEAIKFVRETGGQHWSEAEGRMVANLSLRDGKAIVDGLMEREIEGATSGSTAGYVVGYNMVDGKGIRLSGKTFTNGHGAEFHAQYVAKREAATVTVYRLVPEAVYDVEVNVKKRERR